MKTHYADDATLKRMAKMEQALLQLYAEASAEDRFKRHSYTMVIDARELMALIKKTGVVK